MSFLNEDQAEAVREESHDEQRARGLTQCEHCGISLVEKEKPIYPLNQVIIDLCQKQIDKNFDKKGNSWTNGQFTPKSFLENKLQEEYAEFVTALNKNDDYEIGKEGSDLINIISMLMCRYGATASKTKQSRGNR